MKTYRVNGAVGAILDEYERSIDDLKKVISEVSDEDLISIIGVETKDTDCRSIQTVLTHVVRSGYGYANVIRAHQGESVEHVTSQPKNTAKEYLKALDDMFAHNVKLFDDYPDMQIGELDNSKKILTSWGQLYDPEQLLEHAIVHILRHRRQIERFIIQLR